MYNSLLTNINKSSNRYITEDNSIICPLSIIKNVGTIISNNILNERNNGEFITLEGLTLLPTSKDALYYTNEQNKTR